MSGMIKIEELSFSYGKIKALDAISLEIQPGKVIGLLGPNGAGKTTLIKILTGFLKIPANKVFIDGVDVHLHNTDIKRKIGVIPQEDNLYVNLSAVDNLKLHCYLFGINSRDQNVKIYEWLQKVGLWERHNDPVKQLSRGMRRRITFVRSIIHDPEILFLDEPTTGLDVQTRLAIWEWIQEFKERGKLVFLTTHSIDEAEQLCDEIIILDHGIILERGSPIDCRLRHVGKVILELETDLSLEKLQAVLPGRKISVTGEGYFFIRLDDLSESSTVLDMLDAKGIDFNRFSTKKTTLEETFIHLTGRRIRE